MRQWSTVKIGECYSPLEDGDAALGCLHIDDTIKTRPWGERSFYATDPFGNKCCMVDARTEFRDQGMEACREDVYPYHAILLRHCR
jgi:hypothetical protein